MFDPSAQSLRVPRSCRCKPWIGATAAIAFAAACAPPATAQTAPGQSGTSSALTREFDVTGYVDLYFQFDFGQRHGTQPVSGRWYDTNQGSYKLAAVQVDISRSPSSRDPFGFFVSVYAGPNAAILAATEPGGINTYKDFMQAYITYRAATRVPLTVDFGKWYAFVGYEGLDSRTQDNYSRSFTFTSLEPDYMTGLRTTASVNPKLTVAGYLYEGYNEVKDSNSTPTVGAGATYALSDRLTATFQGYYGEEGAGTMNQSGSFGGIGFPTSGASRVSQGNLILNDQTSAKDKVALDADLADASGKGTWAGVVLYYRRQPDSKNAFSVRVERASDPDGLRFLAGPLLLHSLTLTYDYTVTKNLQLRFEARGDIADHPYFNADGRPTRQRTTFTFAQILKF